MYISQHCLLQESCARILLYRGANKDTKNNSGQTPFQVMAVPGWVIMHVWWLYGLVSY